MPVRVSHRNLFSNLVYFMNQSATQLMELNMQAASQKKVNRPSDDPVNSARILNYRNTLSAVGQYQDNVTMAKGWLSLADNTLLNVNNMIIRAKELAEQAATGTMSRENREQISYEVQQLFQELIRLGNTSMEGKRIFAGHKVNGLAFEQGLSITTNDSNVQSASVSVEGSIDQTVLVQFTDTGQVGAADLDFRYSTDGGRTWSNSTLTSGTNIVDLGSARVTIENGTQITANDPADSSDTSGTWMWVRQAAFYRGDDEDTLQVDNYGRNTLTASASGSFDKNLTIRIDQDADLDERIEYSYSLDGGINWVEDNVVSNAATPSSASLVVPGGFLDIASNGGNSLFAGDQFVIRPNTAAINVEISPDTDVQVNHVGKEIFGGLYQAPGASNASPVFGGSSGNVFETMGDLIAYLDTNNQAGVQRSLESLDLALTHVSNHLADIGAKENRLQVAETILSNLDYNTTERLSDIEDADLAELMTNLTHQRYVYEAVLKSSSSIMKMGLFNYI